MALHSTLFLQFLAILPRRFPPFKFKLYCLPQKRFCKIFVNERGEKLSKPQRTVYRFILIAREHAHYLTRDFRVLCGATYLPPAFEVYRLSKPSYFSLLTVIQVYTESAESGSS